MREYTQTQVHKKTLANWRTKLVWKNMIWRTNPHRHSQIKPPPPYLKKDLLETPPLLLPGGGTTGGARGTLDRK